MPQKEKLYLGVEWEHGGKPYAYCGSLKWDIKPLAHTGKNMHKINAALTKYENVLNEAVKGNRITETEKLEKQEEMTNTILTLALEKFNYDDAANHKDAGPGLLVKLAVELKGFLGEGGALGMRHLQTRLNSTTGT